MDTIEISDHSRLPVQPLLSVCMVAYRHERFVAKAIEGVLAQRCTFPIELVVSDDCSPDSTGEIVLGYQKRYPSIIRVIASPTNVGAYANEKRCIEACRGEFVAVCEGDDYWLDPTKLQRQVDLIQRTPNCLLVFHPAAIVTTDGVRTGTTARSSLYSRIVGANEVILGDGGFMPTCSMVFKTSLSLNRPSWWADAPVGDYTLALKAAAIGSVAYIDRVMSAYRVNVPHSWTQRYAAEFAHRVEHARRIDAMLQGFSVESGMRYQRAIASMVSKYYSDALVRLPAASDEHRAVYAEVRGKMRGTDRLLAFAATRTGWNLSALKDILRKSRTLFRVIGGHFTSRRIRS